MAEAANKILKYRYLFPNNVADTEELTKVLDNALNDYNNMPQKNLCALTPNEVLSGNIPYPPHQVHIFRSIPAW